MNSLEKPLLGSVTPPKYSHNDALPNAHKKPRKVFPREKKPQSDPLEPQLSKICDPQPLDEERHRASNKSKNSPGSQKRGSASCKQRIGDGVIHKHKLQLKEIKSATVIPQSTSKHVDNWHRLENLTQLKDIHMISQKEYEERKQQLIDELTGTTIGTRTSKRAPRTTKPHKRRRKKAIKTETKASDTFPNPNSGGVATVVPGGPPDWRLIKSERAIKHTFNTKTKKFETGQTEVKISKHPFARGALRLAYYMKEVSDKTDDSWSALNGSRLLVAKISIDPFEEKDIYFQDVSMQALGQEMADKYNVYNPPKRVGFIPSWVCQLVDRPMEIYCGVEQFIEGSYRKHNNNFGYVDEDERNTPQAFSHFTYEVSKQTMLMCDIQGVSDLYTDPQIHTVEGVGFGKGNMGQKGIDEFMATHRCNPICRYLKLIQINPKPDDLSGTLPNARFMSYKKVEIVTSVSGNYQNPVIVTPHTPLLPPRKKASKIREDPAEVQRKVKCGCCTIL